MKSVTMMALLGLGMLAATRPAAAQDAAAGEKDYAVCKACHQVGPGAKNLIGPNHNGLIGRTAGTVPGYIYSPANKNSGIVWTAEILEKYIANPQSVVPGTKMAFAGVKDPQKVKDIIAYLSQFNADGSKKTP